MSTQLERFRDHCRTEAARDGTDRPKGTSWWCRAPEREQGSHANCSWGWQSCRCTCHDSDRPKPPSDADRALWIRLADEIAAYLAGDLCPDCGQPRDTPDDQALWEDASP